jgi:Leucine-rich repeat (LRR) protein
MKLKLLFLLFLTSVSSFAQYTLIPDAYFETELIRQGIDSGTPDGKVLTSKINTLTTLNVRGVGLIADLTGIQDFTALKYLLCDTNQLTALDVSRNTALTYLSFGNNYLTAIDVSKNTALTELRCYANLLTTLDVSRNTALTILHCYINQLKTLDVSKNTALTYLACNDNQLTGLNLKNGNNSKLSTNSVFSGNPELSCIQVDDVAYANANWASAKDDEASYSLDCSAVVQYTLIPDVNFEQMLIQLGYDFGTPDGKVTTSKISGVTSLDISGRSITDLTGIQDFVALQSLNCRSNQLTALDVSNNIALKYLVCYSNQLTALDVSMNTALEQLTCYSNKLTTLDVSKNVALKYLYCYENQLTALDVSMNTALTKLDCYTNQLTSLNVSQNVSLTELNCYSNKLTSFDVSKSIVLTKLYCYSNQLTALDVSKNIALIELYSYSNQLTALDVSKNTALKSLYCYSNQLSDLDVSKNTRLGSFDCSSNQLTSLNLRNGNNSNFSTKNFTNNPNLSCIQVDNVTYSKNNWSATSIKDATASYSSDCSAYILIPDVNFEKKLISLGIDFGTPDGKVLTSNIDTLTSLDVSSSSITDLTGIQNFVALKSLFCSDNQLTSLNVSKNTLLESLDCSSNQLTALDLSKHNALRTLYCSSNQLTILDLFKNLSLRSLWCDQNQLTSLNLPDYNWALTDINCYDNQLISLNISNKIALTKLNCYNNQLMALDLSSNTNITELNCYSNKLTSLNLKNGQNVKLSTKDFTNNPNLSCIQVDNVAYSDANWATSKDATASYNTDCLTYTLIPDVNFEKKLISLGIDTGAVDGQVSTYKINTLTSLDVASSSIADLYGIQAFVGLQSLNCNGNQLTSLNVSKNTLLKSLDCSSNQLTSLNVKNGNNTSLNTINFTINPNLSCIQVDDVAYSDANWATAKDATASYTASCPFFQYTLIPDVNFENKLIAAGYDSGTPDGKVLTTRISSLTSLDVSYSSIADLTGIQDFEALTSLNCNNNNLTALNVSKNTPLMYLQCQNNQFTTLDVSKNNTLKTLNCDGNQLTTLDISKNVALTSLTCELNKLTTLDVFNNVSLTTLYCGSNQLTALDVSKNTALKYFYCYKNLLTTLDVSKNTALDSFYCYSNSITALDVSKNVSLKKLHCYSNKLISLDVSKNTALESFYCYSNSITALDVSKNTALIYLGCQSNQLTSLNIKNGKNTNLLDKDFTKNPNLSCIQVDNAAFPNSGVNWANYKDATASYSDNCSALAAVSSEFEDKLIALGIDTDGKNDSVLLSSIINVTSLNVSNSGLTSLSGIEYFSNLETLNCQGNLLTTINVSSNPALKYLDCSKNPLLALDVSKNTQLSELYCDGIVTTTKKINAKTSVANQLNVLDVSNNLSLTKLSCSNNQIVSLDLSKNTLLTDVNCSNNSLQTLNLSNGNNAKLSNLNFKTNASLSCIQVDDIAYSNANWLTAKDAAAIYSKTACTLGIEDVVFDKIAVYPNPTKGEIHIDNCVVEKARMYDALGKLVTTKTFTEGSNNNTLNLAGFPRGIYYIYLESAGATSVKKIVVE